jgi:hypothetical protein
MKRISRHTVVALIIAMLTSLGGMGVAVVAFGQDGPDQDAGIPAGDFTTTTPRQATAPTSGYTNPAATTTTPLSGYTNTSATTTPSSTVTAPSSTSEQTPTESDSAGSGTPTTTHGTSKTPVATPLQPSRATRRGPTHLAFTGADPLLLGSAGAGLMLAGLGLHLRRRKATQLEL